GEIDWQRRYDHMQQHTGQHLLSAVLADRFGWATTSVHFGPVSSTIDLATDSAEPEQLREAELAANRIIAEARPVTVSFESADAAADLRKASSRTGTLRIITIADTDRSACGGTHVSSTAELAPLLIRRAERAKRAVRVEFVCGERALRRARADYEALTAAGRLLTVSPDEVPGAVELLQGQFRDAASARRRLEEEVTGFRARELYDASVPDQSGRRVIIVDRPAEGLDELRALAPALSRLDGAWFLGINRKPPAVVFAAAADTGVDAGQTLRGALAQAGGRGGGSPRVAQGTVADPAELDRIIGVLRQS
ncbi:MAG TPA: alanyl-tRNA editing protein, partial [Gemmatimonadales bacterium]|nr:alanyl-tRNA editing protein [Gemmatimonadales bacterium]